MPNELGSFPIDGYVRRARRRADLSQRALARRAGVSPTTVARVESGSLEPSLKVLRCLLEATGLQLAVMDLDGRLVLPLEVWAEARDGQGRRFPPHLDLIPDVGGVDWWGSIYGLLRPPETFHVDRHRRDRERRESHEDVRHRTYKRPL